MYLSNRKVVRLSNHDYSSDGIYYVTICTEGRQYLLGSKCGELIKLTEIGEVVQDSWARIGRMYEGISLDEYVVMPNHLHGIIVYHYTKSGQAVKPLQTVICNFKSFTTHEYYKNKTRLTGNLWSRGYYEHVIRQNEVDVIREYIMSNPVNWENDKFYEMETKYLQLV